MCVCAGFGNASGSLVLSAASQPARDGGVSDVRAVYLRGEKKKITKTKLPH